MIELFIFLIFIHVNTFNFPKDYDYHIRNVSFSGETSDYAVINIGWYEAEEAYRRRNNKNVPKYTFRDVYFRLSYDLMELEEGYDNMKLQISYLRETQHCWNDNDDGDNNIERNEKDKDEGFLVVRGHGNAFEDEGIVATHYHSGTCYFTKRAWHWDYCDCKTCAFVNQEDVIFTRTDHVYRNNEKMKIKGCARAPIKVKYLYGGDGYNPTYVIALMRNDQGYVTAKFNITQETWTLKPSLWKKYQRKVWGDILLCVGLPITLGSIVVGFLLPILLLAPVFVCWRNGLSKILFWIVNFEVMPIKLFRKERYKMNFAENLCFYIFNIMKTILIGPFNGVVVHADVLLKFSKRDEKRLVLYQRSPTLLNILKLMTKIFLDVAFVITLPSFLFILFFDGIFVEGGWCSDLNWSILVSVSICFFVTATLGYVGLFVMEAYHIILRKSKITVNFWEILYSFLMIPFAFVMGCIMGGTSTDLRDDIFEDWEKYDKSRPRTRKAKKYESIIDEEEKENIKVVTPNYPQNPLYNPKYNQKDNVTSSSSDFQTFDNTKKKNLFGKEISTQPQNNSGQNQTVSYQSNLTQPYQYNSGNTNPNYQTSMNSQINSNVDDYSGGKSMDQINKMLEEQNKMNQNANNDNQNPGYY